MSNIVDPIQMFCRHIIALVGSYVVPNERDRSLFVTEGVPPSAERIHYVYIGVPVVLNGKWYALTAGHSVISFMKGIRSNQIVSTGGSICDFYGPINSTDLAIPFEIKDYCKYMIDDPGLGLDYAMLELSENHARLLAANKTIPYDTSGSCHETSESEREYCLVLGFPSEDTELVSCKPGRINHISVCPHILPILRLKNDDAVYPRFAGRIHGMGNLKSLVGFSGGPIFGLDEDDEGMTYTIEGIQSRWARSRLMTYGTRMPAILDHFAKTQEKTEEIPTG